MTFLPRTTPLMAEDAEMSISALNEHRAKLEEIGLIHRIRANDPRTHRSRPTRYIPGFEKEFPQKNNSGKPRRHC